MLSHDCIDITDVMHLEWLSQISRQPSVTHNVKITVLVLVVTLSDQLWAQNNDIYSNFDSQFFYYKSIQLVRLESAVYFTIALKGTSLVE